MKKPFLIFSLALNIILVITLALFLICERKEEKEEEHRLELLANSERNECISLLDESTQYFASGRKSDARACLMAAQYIGGKNDEFSELSGITAYCFFEGDGMKDSEFPTATEMLTSVILEKELTDEQSELAEKLRSEYEYKNFARKTYPSLSSHIPSDPKKTKSTAEKRLGRGVSLSRCECNLFPLLHVYKGGNTFASLTEDGGKLIELYFYLGDRETILTEEEAVKSMRAFLKEEGFPELSLADSFMREGFMHAIFEDKKVPEKRVKIIASAESGRVCFFHADEYYSK